jgi:hypothetical protein
MGFLLDLQSQAQGESVNHVLQLFKKNDFY